MLRAVSRRSALAALVVTSALAAPSRAADTVPITAQGFLALTGQAVDPVTGDLILSVDLTGTSSHMGRGTGTGIQVTYAPDYVQFQLNVIQVAANGDELFVTYDGSFIDASFDSTGTFTITGGTGRFAGASGSGTFVSFAGGAQVYERGQITTVGSGKK
jgi:hypothetical protein